VRIGAVDPRTGRLWIANSPIPSEKDPEVRWVFSLDPGDRTALSDAHAAR
jgi:DNA primase